MANSSKRRRKGPPPREREGLYTKPNSAAEGPNLKGQQDVVTSLSPFGSFAIWPALLIAKETKADKAIKVGSDKFVAQNDWVDSELKRQTVGLVRLEDFQRIRSTLEEKKRQDDQDTSSSKRDVHERGE
ncbi:hypothetical protein BASA82_000796, partial [Batrachochytrium salamandrivorans]